MSTLHFKQLGKGTEMTERILAVFFLPVWLIMGSGMFGSAGATLKTWKVGKGGLEWTKVGTLMGLETVETSIQPVQFLPHDNIMRKIKWRDGKPRVFITEGDGYIWDNSASYESDLVLIDGDPNTSTGDRFKAPLVNQTGRTFYFDLGAPRFASRFVFYPRQSGSDESGHLYSEDFIKGFQIFISDGTSFDNNGYPVFFLLRQVSWNTKSVVDIRFALQPIRFIKLRVTSKHPFEIAEVELYGEGFPKQSKYISKVIDLNSLANFGILQWHMTKWKKEGDEILFDPEARVSVVVETRSGKDDTPSIYYKKVNDQLVEVSKEEYEKLPSILKGPVLDDTENWSPWSLPHLSSGELITSPGPRRYFQFRFEVKSASIWEFGRIDYLIFQYSSPPLAKEVKGEIASSDNPSPRDGIAIVTAGRAETFIYDIRARIEPNQYGFDAVEIEVPSQPSFKRLEMGEPLVSVEPDSVVIGPKYLKVFFPSNGISYDRNLPVRIVFDSEVLLYGTRFGGKIFKLQSQELPQLVVDGDANPEVDTNTLRVLVTKQSLGNILRSLSVHPNPVTPNADGTNDKLTISYTITQLREEKSVHVEIYDLRGKVVKSISKRAKRGKYYTEWDCRDKNGTLVPPGVYICKVSVRTDEGTFEKTRAATIIY
nr:T9SS type A sorting domain-containing protein [Desulfobacterales bacterium]